MCPVNLNAAVLKLKSLTKYFGLRFLVGCLFLGFSCKQEDKTKLEIEKIPVNLNISRFDREFSQASAENLGELKQQYPYLFPAQFPDSIWLAKLSDTIQIELSEEVEMEFGDFKAETDALTQLFKHIQYYFPQTSVPEVVTITSDVRYNDRVILTDTLLLLGLDCYLGQDHRFYQSIQRYVATGLDKRYIDSDVASAFAKKVIRYPRNRTFLARMVHYGKELYLKDRLLPEAKDADKIGYTDEEMEWALANEEQIWRHFVERELLYSTDSKLDRRFLDPAPFSKFQLELDNESPGRLGRYMGWQIVRAFMQNNDLSLQQMLSVSGDEIFRKSNYKPRK